MTCRRWLAPCHQDGTWVSFGRDNPASVSALYAAI